MIKNFYCAALLFLGCMTTSIAQKNFPEVATTNDHLLMTRYAPDTTANALVLFEKGKAEIKKDAYGVTHVFFEHYVKIKIFNKTGMDKSVIEIPLYRSSNGKNKESLESVKAMVTNTDRTVNRLDRDEVYYEDVNENVQLAKFTFPNLQPGCVIDYKYVVKSDYFYNFQSWEFQDDIPKLHSEYHTVIPGNYEYNTTLYGPLELHHQDAKLQKECFRIRGLGVSDCVVAEYIMKDIPAFIEEKYMTAKKNYLSALRFELRSFQSFKGGKDVYAKTWESVDKELKYSSIGKEASKENYFAKNLPEHLLQGNTDLAQAMEIYKYLKEHLYWTEYDHLHRDSDVKKAFEEGRGSSTELNLVLLNVLNSAGFEARPMLVSTRNNGIPSKTIPGISQFDALIVKLDLGERAYLLDIVDKKHPFGMIRHELLNQYGRVLDFKEGSYWYPLLPPESYSQRIFQAYIDLETNKAKVREISHGYDALRSRRAIASDGQDEYLDAISNALEARGNFSLEEYTNKELEAYERPFSETYEIGLNMDTNKERLILNPFLIESFSASPFKLVKRTYPVDFAYPFSIKFTIMINPGDEFSLATKPENMELKLPEHYGKLYYHISETNGQIKIDLNLDINDPMIPATYYEALKEFFNEFVRLQNKNAITLEKSSELSSENAGK